MGHKWGKGLLPTRESPGPQSLSLCPKIRLLQAIWVPLGKQTDPRTRQIPFQPIYTLGRGATLGSIGPKITLPVSLKHRLQSRLCWKVKESSPAVLRPGPLPPELIGLVWSCFI